MDFARSCPSHEYLFPHSASHPSKAKGTTGYVQAVRTPLANHVAAKCPSPSKSKIKRSLLAIDFESSNQDHMDRIRQMGISIVTLQDGRVQLLHNAGNAASSRDAEEGMIFMQEMIELSQHQQQQQQPAVQDTPLKLVKFTRASETRAVFLMAGPAQFGEQLVDGSSVRDSFSEPC